MFDEFTAGELFWILVKSVIYSMIGLYVLGQILPRALSIYRWIKGDLSGKISFAFGLHSDVKEPLRVERLKGVRDTYIMWTGKNAVSFDDLVKFIPRAEAAMAVPTRLTSFERCKQSDAIRIGFGMNKSRMDDEGRLVGTLKWKDFPPPYMPDEKKLYTRTTVNLAIQGNGRGIQMNWMQSPFLLVAAPTAAGKTKFLHYLIAQTALLYPSHFTIVSTEKGLQDWLRVVYSPSVWMNYNEDTPAEEYLNSYDPFPNIVVVTDREQFKNAVAEISEVIEQRKLLLHRYGVGDLRELPKIKAYRNNFGDEVPEQIFFIVDDLTPMEGTGVDDELDIVVGDWVSFTRTVAVHVWAFLQDPRIKPQGKPDLAKIRRQAMVVSLAGMSAVQNKMILGLEKATPNVKGCIGLNVGDVLQTGIVPEIDQTSLAGLLEASCGLFSQRQLRDFGIYRDKLNKVGFTGTTLERKLRVQHQFVRS